MDQRGTLVADSRVGHYLQTKSTAPHARDEVIPLCGSDPKHGTRRVLAVSDNDTLSQCRNFKAVAGSVASCASSPPAAGVISLIADVVTKHHALL
jgi:hypothetical protein